MDKNNKNTSDKPTTGGRQQGSALSSIRYKVLIPIVGSVVLGLVLCGVIATRSITSYDHVAEVMEKALEAEKDIQIIRVNFAAANEISNRVLAMSSLIEQEEINRSFAAATTPLNDALNKLEEVAFTEEMATQTAALKAETAEWQKDTSIVLGIVKSQSIPTAQKLQRHIIKMNRQINELSKQIDSSAVEKTELAGEEMQSGIFIAYAITAVIGIIALGGAFLIARSISSPLLQLVTSARELAAGNTDVAMDQRARKDEIGAIAQAIAGFRDGVLQRLALEEEAKQKQKEEEEAQAAQRREHEEMQRERERQQEEKEKRQRRIEGLIAEFSDAAERHLGSVENKMSHMEDTARGLTQLAEETSSNAVNVANASSDSSQNVQTVASSAEEMSSSIAEITQQVTRTSEVVDEANGKARDTNEKVAGLMEAANRISNVASLIQDIAGQTNLLALNATIEAARAGDSGRGFAVVANEVKALATQTATATEEITQHISEIQTSTESTADAMQVITETMQEVQSYTSAIAAAMEQQGAATDDINLNVRNASMGASTVEQNIAAVSESIGHATSSARDVKSVAQDAIDEMTEMKQAVEQFLSAVRAA